MNSRRFITVGWAKLKVIFRNKAVTDFVKQNVLTFARNGAFGRGSGLRFLPHLACKANSARIPFQFEAQNFVARCPLFWPHLYSLYVNSVCGE